MRSTPAVIFVILAAVLFGLAFIGVNSQTRPLSLRDGAYCCLTIAWLVS